MKVFIVAGILIFTLAAAPGWGQDRGPVLESSVAEHTEHGIDAIYPEESRIVIDDREYYLTGPVMINGQEISAGGVLKVLRQGQKLSNIVAERQGQDEVLVLKGADIL